MQYTQLSRRSAGSKIDWEKQYLTFIPVEDAMFSWSERAVSGHLEYSINGGQTWVNIADGGSTPTIKAGSKVMWRGNLEPSSSNGIGTFSASGNYNAYGNIMSLLYYDNYYNSQLDSTKHEYAFYKLFESDTHLLSAPLLTSTTLVYRCYSDMFNGCTSLVTAPELPATTLATSCYSGMFCRCTSLTVAPELPVTTLANGCYFNMFRSCTKLNYIKCLATNISASDCLSNWVTNVASTGTFVKNPNMSSWPTGTSGIPEGWTVVDDNS